MEDSRRRRGCVTPAGHLFLSLSLTTCWKESNDDNSWCASVLASVLATGDFSKYERLCPNP